MLSPGEIMMDYIYVVAYSHLIRRNYYPNIRTSLTTCGMSLNVNYKIGSVNLFQRLKNLVKLKSLLDSSTWSYSESQNTLKKHRLWSRYMETRDDKIFRKYKSARNAVSRDIKKLAKLEQQEVASQCKLNPKKFGIILTVNVKLKFLQ